MEITVTQGEARHTLVLTTQPVHLGRAPDNALSLIDARLSWHHAAFWCEDGVAWVRDLASTNGTFLNTRRLRKPESFGHGDRITLGAGVSITLRSADSDETAPRFVLEDLQRGVRHVLHVGTLGLAEARAASIDLPGPLTLSADGGLSMQVDEGVRTLDIDEVFAAPGGQRIRVTLRESLRVATLRAGAEPYPYHLSVTLDAPSGGAEAILRDRETGRELRITAETRVSLLYLLARQVLADRDAGKPPEAWGWCADEDLYTGIWGRGRGYAGKLSVLIHRVRRDLIDGGFAHELLERGLRMVRARVIDIELR